MSTKTAGANYFVVLLILLGIIAILVLTAFVLITSVPGALASPPPSYEIRETYECEPWSFQFNGLVVTYRESGIIVPVYRDDKQEGALFLGEGLFLSRNYSVPSNETAGVFVLAGADLFEESRGDIIFLPVEDWQTRKAAEDIFKQQPGLPVIWQSGIPLVFIPRGNAAYYYFLDQSGAPLLPPVLVDPPRNLYGAAAVYILFFAVVILTLLIFSLDHRPSRYWQFVQSTRPRWPGIVAVLGAAGLALGGEMLPRLAGWPENSLALGYLVAIAGLIIMAKLKQIKYLDFGLRPDMLRNGYLMVAAAAILFFLMTRGWPSGLAFRGLATVVEFISVFFLVALAREMVWRGYIQTTLGRLFGTGAGLVLTVILTALVHYIVLTLNNPWAMEYPYTLIETAVLVPGSAAVLGFLYMRTENIFSCALLHSLIIFLPRIMIG